MESAVCVTNEANQNLIPSYKELLRWHFKLKHIGLQHVQWFIHTGSLKVQVNSKALDNRESYNCDACEFGNVRCQSNKLNTVNNNTVKVQELKMDLLLT